MTTVTHKHAGGSVGGPGENDAECACGLGFYGFDTQAEAMRVLDAHIAEATAPRDPWAQLAAQITSQPLPDYAGELSVIAADVAALTGSGLPKPGYLSLKTQLILDIQPGVRGDDESIGRGVDALAQMLLGRDGEPRQMSSGNWHYSAQGDRGPIEVRIYNAVSAEWAARQVHQQKAATERAELLARLATAEADAAKLRAQLAERTDNGLGYSRDTEPEQVQARPDTLGVHLGHHGPAPEVRHAMTGDDGRVPCCGLDGHALPPGAVLTSDPARVTCDLKPLPTCQMTYLGPPRGLPCGEPIERNSLGLWVHADRDSEAAKDHSAVGRSA